MIDGWACVPSLFSVGGGRWGVADLENGLKAQKAVDTRDSKFLRWG